ncbi:MAG: DNA methyltransferase [Devosia sp.]
MAELIEGARLSQAANAFISRWQGKEGGAERANYALFLSELCDVLGVPRPQPSDATHAHNDYAFERAVTRREAGDKTGHGRIDLYKRGSFILEAKQSRWKGGNSDLSAQGEIFDAAEPAIRGKRNIDRNWDILMVNARRQAEDYARNLPADHDWPPFIIVCDVGHAFEIFADFNGKGRDYAQFPDRQGFRIFLEDLRREEIRERLRLIWTDPSALDPTKKAAEATREVADRLAQVSKSLEERGFNPERVAQFLMRCLFTMFAEDVELLPKSGFTEVLKTCVQDPSTFEHLVGQLWQAMNTGDFAFAIKTKVKRFNGEFFRDPVVLPLNKEEIGELLLAAGKDWRNVEPAIFGSLVEGALEPGQRSRLGAHYTPRPYVERLVSPTIMEPLRKDWTDVGVTVEKLMAEDRRPDAISEIKAFHEQLCATRVLDPACGTANFLYVAMAQIKKLEDEVLEALSALGGQEALALDQHRVDPHQFLGIELNPRAAAIAELVLWIGFLQIHYRSNRDHPTEPILRAFHNIECRDAVLAWDGYPNQTFVEGVEAYANPRRPDWPMAEFIVGNPPFVGGKDIRSRMGDAYIEALWAAHPKMNDSADFVMYWWDRCAELLIAKGTLLRRFGLVTTSSVTQVFQRRTIERHLTDTKPISLVMAVPNHPWTKASRDAAAVRIAMTVAEAGARDGSLYEVASEAALETDEPKIELNESAGHINADLTVGIDVAATNELRSNVGLSSRGMMLFGSGFIVSKSTAGQLGLGSRPGLERHIRPYLNGRDLTATSRQLMAMDFFGLKSEEVRERFPEAYQHLLETVKPERDNNRDKDIKSRWWLFGRTRDEIRPALQGLPRYLATVETSKHRVFQFLDAGILPDNKLVIIACDDAFHLGVLSSRIHVSWALRAGGWLGQGNDPVYVKSRCFDPFPFPDPPEMRKAEVADFAEKLDAHRKLIQSTQPDISLTEIYNALEAVRSGSALSEREEDVKARALVLVLKEFHDELDAAVSRAYGWQEALTEQEILARLVALNLERTAEEARGQVRWLRPDYQIPRFGSATQKVHGGDMELVAPAQKGKPNFPASDRARTFAISSILASAADPITPAEVAARFKQGKKVQREVELTLKAFVRYGDVVSSDGGKHFALRRAA